MKFEAYSYNPFSGGGSGGGTPLENKTIELPYVNNSSTTIETGQLIRSDGIVNNDNEIVIDGTETNLSSVIGFSKTAVTPTNKGHIITTGIVEKTHSYNEGDLAYLNTTTGVVSNVSVDESTIIGIFLSDNRFYLQGISLNNTAGKLPTGGLTNDILIKKSGSNYDTEWVSELKTLNLDTDYVPTGTEPVGSSFYDSANRCITTILPDSELQNGKELYTTILNQTGSTILDGQVVYISGAVGMSDVLTGAKFIANGTINDIAIAGIATQDIANGAKGEITHFGTVRGLNTTGTPYGEVWNEGDMLYASAIVAGRLTNVQPQAPNLSIKIGCVVNKHANVGSIFVQPTTRSKLTDLYDVNGTPLDTTGQIMIWDNVRKVFDFTDNINTFLKTNTANSTYEKLANKNTANGYCSLDGGGKVPLSNLPSTLLKYVGVWNASTNNPTLLATDLTKIGNVYNVSVAGTQFGITFSLGDWLIYNGNGVAEKSDNSDDVVSVNSKTGNVVLSTADIEESEDRRYITDNQLGSLHIHQNKDFLDNLKKGIVAEAIYVLNADSWATGENFSQNLSLNIPNYTVNSTDYDIQVSPILSSTKATALNEMESYSYIDRAEVTAENTITFSCYSFKPAVNLSIKIELIKNEIDLQYSFTNSIERDTYFQNNPEELSSLMYIYTNGGLQQYYQNTWVDRTTIIESEDMLGKIIKVSNTITSNELNFILANNSNIVKNIYFEAGTYSLDTIRLKSNTHLILDENAIINVSNTHLFFNFESSDTEVIGYNGQGNIIVEGGTINGHACSFIHADNVLFKDIQFNNSNNDHYFEIAACRNFRIENCHFKGMIGQIESRRYVEYVQLDQPSYTGFPHLGNIDSTTFDGTPNTNIYIIGNTFDKSNTPNYENIYCAIGSHGSGANYQTQIVIKDNKFYNCTHAAIASRGWKNVYIENNTFEDCEAALQLKYGNKDISFKNNSIDGATNAIYTLNDNNSTYFFLKIDGNKFTNCLHRLNSNIIEEDGITPNIYGGQISDTNNIIEDCGTDIIRCKSFYYCCGNTFLRINEAQGYVILLDKTSDCTIVNNRFSQITLKNGESNFNIARILTSYSSLMIGNNRSDSTLLYNAALEDGTYVNSDGNTRLITNKDLDLAFDNGKYYGYSCTHTPSEIGTDKFNLDISGDGTNKTQTIDYLYKNKKYMRTYFDNWKQWVEITNTNSYTPSTLQEYDYLNSEMNLSGVDVDANGVLKSGSYYAIVFRCKAENAYTICRTKCAETMYICESSEYPKIGTQLTPLFGNLTTANYLSTNTGTTTVNGKYLIAFYFASSKANGYTKNQVQEGITVRNSIYGSAWCPYIYNQKDILYGKVITAIGDSYVKGNSLGDHQTWLAKIARRNGMTYYNRGKNGDMIAWNGVNNLDNTSVVRRFDAEMPASADVVIIFGGHNDATRAIPIGTNTDADDSTFKGALNLLISKAITKYPKSLIIFITPSYRYGAEITYSDAMQELCRLNNIICINSWTDFNFTLKNSAQKLKYDERYIGLYDYYGTDKNHFSEDGHERLSYIIEQKIRANFYK